MDRVIMATAGAAGLIVRAVLLLLGWVPVVSGPALVLYGTWQIYHPACYILAGVAISALTFVQANPRRERARAVSSSRS